MSVHPLEGPWVASRGWQLRTELPPPSCAGFCGGVCSRPPWGTSGSAIAGSGGKSRFRLGRNHQTFRGGGTTCFPRSRARALRALPSSPDRGRSRRGAAVSPLFELHLPGVLGRGVASHTLVYFSKCPLGFLPILKCVLHFVESRKSLCVLGFVQTRVLRCFSRL